MGIPTVLHVLHVRSESQEGTEVTRQLWLILANDGPLAATEEDWTTLLCFLVMPFGCDWCFFLLLDTSAKRSSSVWVMSSTEIEMWEVIFGKAIAIASRTAQTKATVLSHFLELLGEEKLVL